MPSLDSLVALTSSGLYCPAGDFYIDPWLAVERAVITHVHSDHARPGTRCYIAHRYSEKMLRWRLGSNIHVEAWDYGQPRKLGDCWVSLHPAGHILGSSQVRIESSGKVVVITGDYKRDDDPTCEPFEVSECDLLITESTFGLPVFRWPAYEKVISEVHQWWRENQRLGRCSVLLGYAVGKAQRILSLVDDSIGPVVVHGAVIAPTLAYQSAGIRLPELATVRDLPAETDWSRCLVIAPPGAQGTPWLRRFGEVSLAIASGWMSVRGMKRRRAVDRGFVISDHVDWQGLMATIEQSKASSVWVTHGFSAVVARYLRERGLEARSLSTRFSGETLDAVEEGNDELLETVTMKNTNDGGVI